MGMRRLMFIRAPFAYGGRRRRRCLRSHTSMSTITQRTHAAGNAIDIARPAMRTGAERMTAPSTTVAVPTMETTAKLPPANLTFQLSLVSMSLHSASIATGWAICHKLTEPLRQSPVGEDRARQVCRVAQADGVTRGKCDHPALRSRLQGVSHRLLFCLQRGENLTHLVPPPPPQEDAG